MLPYIVLYSKNLQVTFLFFELFGFKLIKEQHGNSPIHYSLKLESLFIEFYPKKKDTQSEFILGLESQKTFSEIIQISKGKNYFYKEFNNFVSVWDSFGNKVHLYYLKEE